MDMRWWEEFESPEKKSDSSLTALRKNGRKLKFSSTFHQPTECRWWPSQTYWTSKDSSQATGGNNRPAYLWEKSLKISLINFLFHSFLPPRGTFIFKETHAMLWWCREGKPNSTWTGSYKVQSGFGGRTSWSYLIKECFTWDVLGESD